MDEDITRVRKDETDCDRKIVGPSPGDKGVTPGSSGDRRAGDRDEQTRTATTSDEFAANGGILKE